MITLYHTSHCPNCLAQEKILRQLQTQNSSLEFSNINLETSPEPNVQPPIRSVPTLFINNYRFEGLMTASQIQQWLGNDNHDAEYIDELLSSGQLQQCLQWLRQHPTAQTSIAQLLADESLTMGVRVGLDAIIEQLADSGELHNLTQVLGNLLDSVADSLRIDILHYLAMIATTDAQTYVKKYTRHSHPEVQRIANELLEEWHDH